MKRNLIYYLFSCLVAIQACAQSSSKNYSISSKDVSETIKYLSSDELQGRNTGTKGIDLAATFIENQFKKAGVKPYFETYRDSFEAKDKVGYNIVGILEGQDNVLKNEFIVLGAHYDHIGFSKVVNQDSIANGANDNASGTTAILEFAKYFGKTKANKRSIVFVLFAAEEMGLLGSDHFAKQLKKEQVELYTMMNFEMIGVPFKDRDYRVFLTGYEMSNMADVMNSYSGENLIGYSEVSKKYNLFKRSDNYAFYKEFGKPCHTISSCDLTNFDFYHHVDDEFDKMDIDFMTKLITDFIPVIEKTSNSPHKDIEISEK